MKAHGTTQKALVITNHKSHWRLILIYTRETAYRLLETVVGVVVIYHAYLSAQYRASSCLGIEAVVNTAFQTEALPWRKVYRNSRINQGGYTIDLHLERLSLETLIGIGLEQFKGQGTPATVDYVFHLVPMEVKRCLLFLPNHHDLFCIALASTGRITVAQGKENQTAALEITGRKVGYIPAQIAAKDLPTSGNIGLPVFHAPVAPDRKVEAMGFEEGPGFDNYAVDIAPFHK